MFSPDELGRLRSLGERPEERASYVAWLVERGDSRARWAQLAPDADDIRYAAWLEADGHRAYYEEKMAELGRAFSAWDAGRQERAEKKALEASIDPGWMAWMSTAARPFEPFFFFNNHGNEREIEEDELPFSDPIGVRGAVVTFDSDLRDGAVDDGLFQDLTLLRALPAANCHSGAATCPIHPFVTALGDEAPLTGEAVLRALRAHRFRSKYIGDLKRTHLPFPGYHPGRGHGVENDEVHDDFTEQHLFATGEEEDGDGGDVATGPDAGAHGMLKRNVVGGQLWYVLLHTTPRAAELPPGMPPEVAALVAGSSYSRYVVLFAVGRSQRGRRLLGVVTHQVCHNLCD